MRKLAHTWHYYCLLPLHAVGYQGRGALTYMINLSDVMRSISRFFRKPTIQFRYFNHNGSPYVSVLIENKDNIPSRYMIARINVPHGTFKVITTSSTFNLAATQETGNFITLYGHDIYPRHFGSVILKRVRGQGILKPPRMRGDCRCRFKGITSFS